VKEVQGKGKFIVYSDVFDVNFEGNDTVYNFRSLRNRVMEMLLCREICV